MYAAADRLLGRLVKVTPSSKVVGDLALQLVGAGVAVEDFAADPGKFDLPDSVVGFLRGELGDPPGGWPEPFRSHALEGRRPAEPPAELSDEDLDGLAKEPRETLNRLLFPGPAQRSSGSTGTPTATPQCCPARSSSTGCAPGPSTRSTSSPASGCSSASRRSPTPTNAACAR